MVQAIADTLKVNSAIEELNLKNAGINKDGMTSIRFPTLPNLLTTIARLSKQIKISLLPLLTLRKIISKIKECKVSPITSEV